MLLSPQAFEPKGITISDARALPPAAHANENSPMDIHQLRTPWLGAIGVLRLCPGGKEI